MARLAERPARVSSRRSRGAQDGADRKRWLWPAFAADAIMEAADAAFPLIVAITEGIPVADMVKVLGIYRAA